MSKKNKKNEDVVNSVPMEELQTMAEVKEQKDNGAAVEGIVNTEKLRIRKEPSTNALVVGYLKKDDVITIVSEDEDETFYKIENGYVMKTFIDLKV